MPMFRGKKWKRRRFTETKEQKHIRMNRVRSEAAKKAWRFRKQAAKLWAREKVDELTQSDAQ